MRQFIRSWKGKISTNWDASNGVSPRTFRLNPSSFNTSPTAFKGTFEGTGSAYDGRAFDVKHGKYSLQTDGTTLITFDMKFISGEPTETFSGHMDSNNTKIKGSVKLKHPSHYDAPHTGSAYANFRGSVSLH